MPNDKPQCEDWLRYNAPATGEDTRKGMILCRHGKGAIHDLDDRPMFPPDFVKWGFIGGLYDVAATAALRQGAILSRKEFLDKGIYVAITPEDLAELLVRGRPFQLVQVQMPGPRVGTSRAAPAPNGKSRIIV